MKASPFNNELHFPFLWVWYRYFVQLHSSDIKLSICNRSKEVREQKINCSSVKSTISFSFETVPDYRLSIPNPSCYTTTSGVGLSETCTEKNFVLVSVDSCSNGNFFQKYFKHK